MSAKVMKEEPGKSKVKNEPKGKAKEESSVVKGDTESSEPQREGDDEKKSTGPFAEGEKVLAYHGPLVYEAKVQRGEYRKKEWRYFLHYLGWSKNWDEWVGTDRLLKHNEQNLAKQKKLFKQSNADRKGKARAATKDQKEENGTAVGKGKKRKNDEAKEAEQPEQVVKLPLPSAIKRILIDDWACITQEDKLMILPTRPSVGDILDKYATSKTKKDSGLDETTAQVVKGIQLYFDKALPAMLLYKQERDQFASVLPEDSEENASDVYGGEHLLRLFVKLPELLVHTNMEDDALNHLVDALKDFLRFLSKSPSFFTAKYGPARK